MVDEAKSPGEAVKVADEEAFVRLVEPYRRELRAHCYRMSGSLHDAEDLVQDAIFRAWEGRATFEGRSSLRTWLYKVTTNVCLNALDARRTRTLPMEIGQRVASLDNLSERLADPTWLEPWPDALCPSPTVSPEARYSERESVALAFLVALQLLPPKQRAVLILRDVFGFDASECAELLDLTVVAVKSALQRARETLDSQGRTLGDPIAPVENEATRRLLASYVEAWESADVPRLVSLLHDDATLAMPPFSEWLRGAHAIVAGFHDKIFAAKGRGGVRLIATRANGMPAFATYSRETSSDPFGARSIQVIGVRGDRIATITNFLGSGTVTPFGLSRQL
jgi:RNA polymerase sigma-70 factor (ECF subfamily)